MHVLYDTRTVHPLDRYDYYRAGAAGEFAPVQVDGRSPGRLLAAMSVAQFGEFKLEVVTWSADLEVVARRTERLIRTCDPECYRVFVSVNDGVRMEQADTRVDFRAQDVALYDLSRPWQATHPTGQPSMRVIMLTFPRTLVPLDPATVRPLVGTVVPRNLPGRGLIAQFLIELSDTADCVEQVDDAAVADLLRDCTVGLIRQRLGQQPGITPQTRRMLYMTRIRTIIRQHLGDPLLDPERIAKAANISPRYLHAIFRDAETTPMQLVKRLRLAACRRSLEDPALAATPIKEIASGYGYPRADQFARDFKQLYGVSANRLRRSEG